MSSRRRTARRVLALPLLLALLPACEMGLPTGAEPHTETNRLDMGDQPKLKPQRGDLLGEHPMGMLAPPVGALAVDEESYPYAQDEADLAAAELSNPLEASPEAVEHGQFIWENVCIVCHGDEGAGDGNLTRLFPAPPSLMTQKVRDWPDGRLFHQVMRGQGSMPSHASVVTKEDIWSVIHHVRSMQERLPVCSALPGSQPSECDPARPKLPISLVQP